MRSSGHDMASALTDSLHKLKPTSSVGSEQSRRVGRDSTTDVTGAGVWGREAGREVEGGYAHHTMYICRKRERIKDIL